MNFYSDKINNEIIDNAPIDTLLNDIDDFKKECETIIFKYSKGSIHPKYTQNILQNENVIIAFYCLDNIFSINNCPSILIYDKNKFSLKEVHYYVIFTCTKRSFRGQGYGSNLFDEFLNRINAENVNKCIKIILSSLGTSILFYESYGFKLTGESILDYPILLKYEKYEKGKEYFIMELCVNC